MRALLITLLAVFGASAAEPLVVTDAWSRASVPGATTAAVYLTVYNPGDAAVDIVAAHCDVARDAMLHESRQDGDLMRMVHLERVRVAPGATVRFEPSGRHLMLSGLAQPLVEGDAIDVELATGTHERISFRAAVGAIGQMRAPAR